MRRFGALIIGLALLALGGCNALEADAAREAQADQAVRQLIAGDDAGLLAQAAPNIDARTAPAVFARQRALIPPGALPEGRTVGWSHQAGTGGEQYMMERVYDYPDHVMSTRTLLVRQGDRWRLAGLNLRVATHEELKPLQFGLTGKSPLQYGVLAAAIVVPLFILATVVTALRRRRWGWAVLSLFGVMALQVDWFSGAWLLEPLHINLLGAGLMKGGSPFASWVLTVGAPLPAILFWVLGRRRPKAPKVPKAPPAPVTPEPERSPDSG
jgi:hypothetical protein